MPIGIIGCVLALPLVIALLLSLAGFCLKPALGLEGRLAILQLQRRPARTGLTVGVLSIAIFVGIGVGHALLGSIRDSANGPSRWRLRISTCAEPAGDGAEHTAAVLPESLETELAGLDGVRRRGQAALDPGGRQGQRVIVIASTFPPDRAAMVLRTGEVDAVRRGLANGEVVLGTALARKLGLAIAHGSHVLADPLRLRQIVWNLVNNAMHSTPAGGQMTVSSSNIGSDLRVVVRDTGVGIEARDLARIFDPFARIEPGKKQGNGLGLGLSIVKGLVAAHGGRVLALSEGPGHGARFVVELPTAPAAAEEQEVAVGAGPVADEASTQQPTSAGGSAGAGSRSPRAIRGEPPIAPKPKRVLLVEDHEDTRAALEVLLTLKGYDVRVAKDMASALEQAREPVDVVVCDIGLPDGSGLDLVRRISAQHPVQAIAITGYGTARDVEASAAAGFAVHLTKPVAADKLLHAIETLCDGDSRGTGIRDS